MTADDEKFFAWLDGELDADQAANVEAEVAADAQLARVAAQHRAIRKGLNRAFDTVIEAPVPERLRSALHSSNRNIVDFGAAKQARESRRGWRPLPQWAGMAATLAVGIGVGTMVSQRSPGPVVVQDGKVYAAAALDRALDTQLASAEPSSAVRIGVTFRDQSGEICRSFVDDQASGLACRSGDNWLVRGMFAAPEGHSAEYRMAAGMDPNLAALIDSTISGEPLDAAQERAARQRGWR